MQTTMIMFAIRIFPKPNVLMSYFYGHIFLKTTDRRSAVLSLSFCVLRDYIVALHGFKVFMEHHAFWW